MPRNDLDPQTFVHDGYRLNSDDRAGISKALISGRNTHVEDRALLSYVEWLEDELERVGEHRDALRDAMAHPAVCSAGIDCPDCDMHPVRNIEGA